MFIRLLMLPVFIAIASASAMAESVHVSGTVSAILAATVLSVAVFVPSATLTRLLALLRPLLVIVLAAPALWMVLQTTPIPVRGFGNPIWEIASSALKEPLAERLTVDVRATLLSLAQYGAVLATAIVTAIITLDRQRAAQMLYVLVSITVIVLLISTWSGIGRLDTLVPAGELSHVANGSISAVLGVLLSTAMAIRANDQLRRRGQPQRFATSPLLVLSGATLSLLICAGAILAHMSWALVVAAFLGAGTLLAAVAIRRWFFGLWGAAGVLATAAVVVVGSFTVIPIKRNTDLTIALSMQNQAATERMLQDVSLGGSGAGSVEALLPIYRDAGITELRERPTAAAAIAIEMGWAFLYGLIVVTVVGAFTLFKRSLSRSYDYVYPAIGAGASVSLLILAFAEGGILDLSVSLLVAAIYGLAFGQSLSGTAREIASWNSREISEGTGRDRAVGTTLAIAFDSTSTRVALACVGLVLTAHAAWALSQREPAGELYSIASTRILSEVLPDKTSNATSVAPVREDARIKSKLAAFMPSDTTEGTEPRSGTRPLAWAVPARALQYSPLRGDLWLVLAAISKRQNLAGLDTAALLKMSYYSAPNEVDLIPLRLSIALGSDGIVKEPELRDLVRRDLRIAVTRQPSLRPAVVAAYQSASTDGKSFVDNLVSEEPDQFHSVGARRP